MSFINPPIQPPAGITHQTFYSQLVHQEIGYNIYLPPDYENSDRRYPVAYHLHGYKGNESSDIWALENVYTRRQTITVFANATSGDNGYGDNELPIESIILTELIPHIDARYRTKATRENRSLSGWSMGGAGSFCYAVTHLELFSSVTAYAGTYHHWYHKDYHTVGQPLDKAVKLFEDMMIDERCFEEGNMLHLIKQNANKIRDNLRITMQVGTADPLICDNEIMHLYLNSLHIPHEYIIINGVAHELDKVVQK